MGQGIGRIPAAPAVGADSAPGLGREPIGRYIAQQRMLRGIDLDEVAARTRIPRRSLERLEAGAFDHNPDGFSRGFVRTVAEAIGLDPDAAVARMRVEPEAARQAGMPRLRRALAIAAGLVLALLLAIAVREWAFAPPPPTAPIARAGGLAVRRDYVRALAAARGIAVARLSARDAVLPAQPLVVEAPAQLAEAELAPAANPPSAVATPAPAPLLVASPAPAPPKRAAAAAQAEPTPSAPTPSPAQIETVRAEVANTAALAQPPPAETSGEALTTEASPAPPASGSEPAPEPEPVPAVASPDAENRD